MNAQDTLTEFIFRLQAETKVRRFNGDTLSDIIGDMNDEGLFDTRMLELLDETRIAFDRSEFPLEEQDVYIDEYGVIRGIL